MEANEAPRSLPWRNSPVAPNGLSELATPTKCLSQAVGSFQFEQLLIVTEN